MVSVALQLPESEAQGIPNGRLMDKFPSTTTLWQVLRKFESGVAGTGASNKNLTARGAPSEKTGEGRLYYEQPVLHVMNRELSNFIDLQKNLAQLGLNSGSALIRLSYRTTETPLEEAMVEIQQYFDSVDGTLPTQSQHQTLPTPAPVLAHSSEGTESPEAIQRPQPEPSIQTEPSGHDQPSDAGMADQLSEIEGTTQVTELVSSTTSRPLSVYRPPSSSTPSAALTQHDEADYTPTVEHAQVHQKMLNQSSRNVRLRTEAEIAQQAEADAEKLAAVREVEIKVRFPDQSSVSSKFGQQDTGSTLYRFVREDCVETQYRGQPFVLRNPGVKLGQKGDTIQDTEKKLIKDLQLRGRVLVVFDWQDGASMDARGARSVLKEELRQVAEEIKVQDVASAPEEKGIRVSLFGRKDEKEEGEGGSGIGKKMPKWLKGLAKK